MSMIPKGGDTIWGNLDWAPEDDYSPSKRKQQNNETEDQMTENEASRKHSVHYGRMISFGKDVAEAPSSDVERIDFRVCFYKFFQYPQLVCIFNQLFFISSNQLFFTLGCVKCLFINFFNSLNFFIVC